MESFELSNSKVEITDSGSWNISNSIYLWKKIASGTWQEVYWIVKNSKNLVFKLLFPETEKTFPRFDNCDFSTSYFYYRCLKAIGESWVQLPNAYDVVWYTSPINDKKAIWFIQSHLEILNEDWYDLLPEIWVINWNMDIRDIWKVPKSSRRSFFTLTNWKVIFADWDKYLPVLWKIATSKCITSLEDLGEYMNLIKNSWKTCLK